MSKKVSVIIPVYNTEEYLKECVESIIHQTYDNIEILLIDDGSTDSSATMCDMLGEGDSRIRVIHISNGGPGKARNLGIELAQGEYILFVDSDDYIEHEAIEKLVRVITADDTDLVCFNFEAFDNDIIYPRETFVSRPFPSISKSDSSQTLDFIYNHRLENYSWQFFYRVSSIKRYNMNYNQNYNFLEDMVMLNHYLRNPLSVSYLNQILYRYRVNNKSITHNLDYKRISDTTNTVEEISKLLLAEGRMPAYSVFCLYQIIRSDDRKILKIHPQLDIKRKELSKMLYNHIDSKTVKLRITYMLYKMNIFNSAYNRYMYCKKLLNMTK